jgi:hypothetical protein
MFEFKPILFVIIQVWFMQIEHLGLEEKHAKYLNAYVYVSSWTKQIIVQKLIYVHFNQINIWLRKLKIAYVSFI